MKMLKLKGLGKTREREETEEEAKPTKRQRLEFIMKKRAELRKSINKVTRIIVEFKEC